MTARDTEAALRRTLAAIIAAGLIVQRVTVAKGEVTVETAPKPRDDEAKPKQWGKR